MTAHFPGDGGNGGSQRVLCGAPAPDGVLCTFYPHPDGVHSWETAGKHGHGLEAVPVPRRPDGKQVTETYDVTLNEACKALGIPVRPGDDSGVVLTDGVLRITVRRDETGR